MKMHWKDTATWTDGIHDRSVLELGALRLIVAKSLRYRPQDWLIITLPVIFHEFVASSINIEEAKIEAINKLESVLQNILAKIH